MAPLRQTRRSRRPSLRSPVQYWQAVAGPGVEINPPAIPPPPLAPSPSPSTATSSNSPTSIITHLPFAPGSSHTRNRKEGHIPRPPNAFMVFRSWLWNKDNLKSIERDNRNVSRIAGKYWNELSEAERAPFRCMAEEAKARHAQLYPQYRYSPTSQKKAKVSQRRPQHNADTEKCKKVADMLLGGVTSRDLAKYLGEERNEVQPKTDAPALATDGTSLRSLDIVPRNDFEGPAAPRGVSPPRPRSKKQKALVPLHLASTLPSQYTAPFYAYPGTEESSKPAPPTRGPSARTPEPVYARNDIEDFVATDDIPYFSLDSCNNLMLKKNDDGITPTLSPPHLEPGAHTVLSGVKPEAASFVDSCVLGAHTTSALVLPAPVPFTDFEMEAYFSLDSVLVPLGSPVFSNPFDPLSPTAGHSAPLSTLDQLFGQSISPLTPIFPTENW